MSSIKISELRPYGAELFQDSESYLNELSESEMGMMGGDANLIIVSSVVKDVISQVTLSQGISVKTFSIVTKKV